MNPMMSRVQSTLALQRQGYRGQTVHFQVGLVTFYSLVAFQDGCLGI